MGALGTLIVIPNQSGGNPNVEIQSETGETITLKPTMLNGVLRYASGSQQYVFQEYITLPWTDPNSTAGSVTK